MAIVHLFNENISLLRHLDARCVAACVLFIASIVPANCRSVQVHDAQASLYLSSFKQYLLLIRKHIEEKARDLTFGEQQLAQVMCDRPEIGGVVRREKLFQYILIWRFAGELKGSEHRVYWDCREPISGLPAEHLPSVLGYPALIRVTSDVRTSDIDKAVMLLFELFNVDSDEEYQQLLSAPAANRKNQEDFVRGCVKREFEALRKTQAYLRTYPFRGVTLKSAPLYFRVIGTNPDFDEYWRALNEQRTDFDPRPYYRIAYKRLVSVPTN